ncbi:MAG: exosortase/archaeosortase family protein [Candidatus Omnitrophica bacterium]|nr:exosortase/archaeosortase family protein [Candidatus Omnitrophota bacterium]
MPLDQNEKQPPYNLKLLVVWLCSLALILIPILPWWIKTTTSDTNNIPHFIVPFVSLFFIWKRRIFLKQPPAYSFRITPFLLALIASTGVLIGCLGNYPLIAAFAFIFLLFFSVRLLWPPETARHLNFPILFLFFALPWNSLLDQAVGFPLRLFAAKFAYWGYHLFGINAHLEGTLVFTDSFEMIMEPACSGLSYTFALLYTAMLLAAITQDNRLPKVLIVISVLPIAVLANGLRVLLIGLIGHYYGYEAAESVFHEFGGLLLFAIALTMLFTVIATVSRFKIAET